MSSMQSYTDAIVCGIPDTISRTNSATGALVDISKAREQHRLYVETLRKLGMDVWELEVLAGHGRSTSLLFPSASIQVILSLTPPPPDSRILVSKYSSQRPEYSKNRVRREKSKLTELRRFLFQVNQSINQSIDTPHSDVNTSVRQVND